MVGAKSVPGTNFRVKRFPWGLETGLEYKLLPCLATAGGQRGQETCWPGLCKWTCPPHPGLPQEALMNEHSGLGHGGKNINVGFWAGASLFPLI